ncbi:PorP/SprF family type IX secretion system membrane protein [Mangrovibacterium diazotrophicum]|uniref:Type IX secretion system PorP/SprF family membrane protein n=1 Tax=Mangrovibacterium diazotrophicum TaxID=1261403 RepID=A0A419VZF7_9BACT|nr:type IX secretion system membrane protein PorP/SprF [Mangrovibacterium diazotrophicum]RKD88529.1 type IX secretion system PorP/SprF family membrane protein [Mangrovibacterium diazotrophicum]
MKAMKYLAKLTAGVVLIVSTTLSSFGQQDDPMYSQYMFNIQAFNPAYVGSWECVGFMVLGRYQWVGFDGAPETHTFTVQAPLRNERIGLGLSVISDNIGEEKRLAFFTDYSYKLKVGDNASLRLGLKAGFTNYKNYLSSYSIIDETDESFMGEISEKFMPNAGVGLFLSAPRYYVGFSIPKILKNDFENGVGDYESDIEYRNMDMIAGYVFDMGTSVKFKPSVMFRHSESQPFVYDLNASFLFKEKFWLGGMFRSTSWNGGGSAFGGNVQFIISEKLRLGYAYDLNLGKIGSYGNGSHEIMISYELRSLVKSFTSPRYF